MPYYNHFVAFCSVGRKSTRVQPGFIVPPHMSITTYYQLLRKSSGKGLRSLRFGLFLQSGHQPINIFMSMFTKAFNHKTFIQ